MNTPTQLKDKHIAIIGLGYVGLPLAVEFGKKYKTTGYDLNEKRIDELKKGIDITLEINERDLLKKTNLIFTSDSNNLKDVDIFIITVPTPINKNKDPDLSPLKSASLLVSSHLKSGDIVIYESTVFPGATEEVCVPILEENSKLKFNKDFFVGYSPERINPGDKEHTLTKILKVTSGSNPEIAEDIDLLYRSIIEAGTFKASSIKVAEAAKVIENTQRDVNIGLINELAIIFDKFNIDTQEVLDAAGTKWNFLPFRPGLVGGHCIGVDPYYLTYKAQSVGYKPEIILAGRRLNDEMGAYVSSQLIKAMLKKQIQIENSNVLILGITFKENCPDLRNTKVIDIYKELVEYKVNVDFYDPWVDAEDAENIYGIKIQDELQEAKYDAVIFAVAHDEFKKLGIDGVKKYCKEKSVLYDLKYVLPKNESDIRL